MKTTSPIADLFGKSPFRPMQRHMKIVVKRALRAGEGLTPWNMH